MSFVKKGAAAFGKLFTVIALAGTFLVGAVGVVYMSLQGEELKVPEMVGKDLVESEKELASLGLRIKKRADRFSSEKPNTILEQLPKAGDTVKTGQMILVVISKTNPDGDEAPVTIKKTTTEEDDSQKIEELISDKPKKSNKNTANTNKKKTETTRDVISNNSNSNVNANSNSNSNSSNSGNSNNKNSNSGDKANKNMATNSNKSNSNVSKPNSNKAAATGGDLRPRKTPQP
ncbi:MAG: PASTA domain-containing protein [Pyrinomonadaceae bacterium]|nr:PASTA domain-containing protein [Pyrinomonadaceae bacterium]